MAPWGRFLGQMKCCDQVIREHQSFLVETKTWEEGLTSDVSRNEERLPSVTSKPQRCTPWDRSACWQAAENSAQSCLNKRRFYWFTSREGLRWIWYVFRLDRLQGPSPCLQSQAFPHIPISLSVMSSWKDGCQQHSSKAMEERELSLQAGSTNCDASSADSCGHSWRGAKWPDWSPHWDHRVQRKWVWGPKTQPSITDIRRGNGYLGGNQPVSTHAHGESLRTSWPRHCMTRPWL